MNDVESWGRLHASQRAAVGSLLESAGMMPGVAEVQSWYDESGKFDELQNVGLGFEMLADFGVSSNAQVVEQTVASALNSESYLAKLRAYVGSEVEQGGTTGGSENEDTPEDAEPSDATRVGKAWIWGAALGALAVLFSRR